VKHVIKYPETLTGRLTLTYAVLSCLVFIALVLSLYFLIFYDLDSWSDDYLEFIAAEINHEYKDQGIAEVDAILKEESEEWARTRAFIRVLSLEGKQLESSDLGAWSILMERIGGLLGAGEDRIFRTFRNVDRGQSVRALQMPLHNHYVLQVGVPLPDYSLVQTHFMTAAFICLLLTASFGPLLGLFVARRAVVGVKQVTQTANLIAKGKFQARVVKGKHGREIDDLVESFNRMIEHINALMEELGEVSNNIAHDLRTPLTRIRSAAEVTLREPGVAGDTRKTLALIVQECERLNGLISDMLEIASIDAGVESISRQNLDMCELVADASELFLTLAEEKGQQWDAGLLQERCTINGDRTRLQRAVANLLDNAIKYTPQQGKIQLKLESGKGSAVFTVCNSGEGISEIDLPHIFDRFYRGDSSRSTIGNGLGLSYARAIAHAHKGTLSVDQATPGFTCFKLVLPI